MRYIVKRDEDKTDTLASKDTYKALLEIVKTKNTSLITDAIYREAYDTPDGKRSKVEDRLAIAYKNKCAYCERLCKADIEHYRPKKGVSDDGTHPGYYWLCYEWSNLIPSCITCNRDGAKHNKFPVLGARVLAPPLLPNKKLNLVLFKPSVSPLLDEKPYLLHPEVDKPECYFAFELDPQGEGIRIVGVDSDDRGKKTIQICLLNRLEVKLDRVERVIDDFKDAIHCLFVQLDDAEISELQFKDLVTHHIKLLHERAQQDDKTHTYLRKYIVASADNFEKIVLPFLDLKVQSVVLEAFKSL